MMSSIECTQIDTVLDRQGAGSPRRRGNISTSAHNAGLVHLDERRLAGRAGSPATSANRAPCRCRCGRSKPLPPLRVSIANSSCCLCCLRGGSHGGHGDCGHSPRERAQAVLMGVLLATGVFLFSVMLASQMRPGSYQPVPEHTVLAAFGLGLLAAMGALFPWRVVPRFVAHGLPCLLVGICMAVVAAALLWPVVRRGAPPSIITTGGMLGATAGLLGVIVLQVKCPHQEALHLLVWHGSVLLIAAGVGVLTGWLLQRSSDSRWPTDK